MPKHMHIHKRMPLLRENNLNYLWYRQFTFKQFGRQFALVLQIFLFQTKTKRKSSVSFLKYLHTKVTVSIEVCLYFLTKMGGHTRDSPFGTFLLGVILAINVCEHIYHKFRSTHF